MKPWGTIRSVVLNGLDEGLGELLHVPIGVDIARRLDRLMAEEPPFVKIVSRLR
jgi:hypothetical protein